MADPADQHPSLQHNLLLLSESLHTSQILFQSFWKKKDTDTVHPPDAFPLRLTTSCPVSRHPQKSVQTLHKTSAP